MTSEERNRVLEYHNNNKRRGYITYDRSAKVCDNCIWYDPMMVQNTGNIACMVHSGYGLCRKRDDIPVRCFRRGCTAYEKSEEGR